MEVKDTSETPLNQPLTLYLESETPIDAVSAKALGAQKDLGRMKMCAPSGLIDGSYWTLTRFERVNDSLDGTEVTVGGVKITLHVMQQTAVLQMLEEFCPGNLQQQVQQFISGWPSLKEEQREQILQSVDLIITEGTAGVVERSNMCASISVKIVKTIGKPALKAGVHYCLCQMAHDDKEKELLKNISNEDLSAMVAAGVTAVASAVVSGIHIYSSVNILLSTNDKEFESMVGHFLPSVVNSVQLVISDNTNIIVMLDDLNEMKREPINSQVELYQEILAQVEVQVGTCKNLIEKVLPGVMSRITLYIEAKEKLRDEKRREAIAAGIMAVVDLGFGGVEAYNAVKAFRALGHVPAKQIFELCCVGIKVVPELFEFGLAVSCWVKLNKFLSLAILHLDAYCSLQTALQGYLDSTLTKALTAKEKETIKASIRFILCLRTYFQQSGENLQKALSKLEELRSKKH